MLSELAINHLGPVHEVVLSFREGLTFFSGESGVGKSVMVKALKLLTGAKADPTYIRRGAIQAQVSGRFLVSEAHTAVSLLRELGLSEGRGKVDILLRRQLLESGRSQAWVNDTPVTIGTLQKIGRKLLSIVSQHEYSRILEEATHLQSLDSFLKDKAILTQFQKDYTKTMGLWEKLTEQLCLIHEKQKFIPLWEYQRQELEALEPKAGEYSGLLSQCKTLAKEMESKSILRAIANDLNLNESVGDVWSRVKKNFGILKKSEHDSGAQLSDSFDEILAKFRELTYSVERLCEGGVGERELEQCEARLAQYQKVVRKFSLGHGDLLKPELDRIVEELNAAKSQQGSLDEATKEFCSACDVLFASKEALTEARIQAKNFIEDEIHKVLDHLKLEQAKFVVELIPTIADEKSRFVEQAQTLFPLLMPKVCQTLVKQLERLGQIQEHGGERARFLFAASQGDPLSALVKVASGGEASRITLSIQSVLQEETEPHTLILDEVDTGVSGEVADRVGALMHRMSRRIQVIGVSHLPQVLAYGDHHFLIEKSKSEEGSFTSAKQLDAPSLERELARLLSSTQLTDASMRQAKQLRKVVVKTAQRRNDLPV